MYALCILLALLLLFTAFILLPMRFGVHYKKTATRNKFYICVSIFGILIRIPIHTKKDGGKQKKEKRKKSREKAVSTSKTEFSFDAFRKKVDALGEIFEVSKNELREMLAYVRKHLSCSEMDFRIAFGLDDAAKTGITTGAVWTSGTFLLKMIDSLIGVEKINMNVYPDFNHKRFEIYFKTILIMRPIHFIIIYIKISKTIKFINHKLSNFK